MDHTLGTGEACADRRGSHRRGRQTFRLRERRTGFERRLTARSRAARAWHSMVRRYGERDGTLLTVLVAVNLLNVVDLLMTIRALQGDAIEANPVLASLFAEGPWVAGAFKVSVLLAMSALVWGARRYRRVLETSVLMLAVFGAVVVYQIVGALWL